jgi:hypothetical protein
MININLIFSNVIFPNVDRIPENLKEANHSMGTFFSEELKRLYLVPSAS